MGEVFVCAYAQKLRTQKMLKLCNITKDYPMADTTVHALRGVSVNFRKSEFVAVLGPSGCGKTTMLNIIGGLDRYTEGDLVIEDRSTKEYSSRDWDKYRNRTVGFVFQSYNLIPHLNVLQNVELALTISGVSRSKKKKLATDALIRVGLGEQLKKKPSQMSGGQMQRVAIARALVNNPEIILADEPTGALDSVTSEQIMDLLQEISDDRLVIMVTHNPELASRYATRTVSLKDGEIVSDTKPYDGLPTVLTVVKPISDQNALASDAKKVIEREKRRAARLAKLKYLIPSSDSPTEQEQAVATEEQNDRSTAAEEKFVATISPEAPEKLTHYSKQPKKKRQRSSMSLLTAVSLSGRNLWTKKARTGLTAFAGSIGIIGIALVLSLSNGFKLYMNDLERSTLSIMPITISSIGITLDVNQAMELPTDGEGQFPDTDFVVPYKPDQAINGLDVSANIITDEYVDYIREMDKSLLSSVQYLHSMNINVLGKNYEGIVKKLNNKNSNWQELLWDDFMKSQYDVLAGGYPGSAEAQEVQSRYDDNSATYTTDTDRKARQIVLVISSYNTIETSILETLGYDVNGMFDPNTNEYKPLYFNELLGKQLKVEHNDDYYSLDEETGMYKANHNYTQAWESDKSTSLTIVGIMRIKPNVLFPFLSQGLAYTEALTELALTEAAESEIAKAQIANTDYNVITGTSFSSDMSSLIGLFSSYGLTESTIVTVMKQALNSTFTQESQKPLVDQINACERINDITRVLEDNGINVGALKSLIAIAVSAKLNSELGADISYTVILEMLNSAYQTQLQTLGASDRPTAIYIYPASFDAKSQVLSYLDAWNVGKTSTETITYTDLASSVAEIVSLVVNLVTYVLIAFAAISLIVSSVMIAIITYISVLERTVEIGVLRSIGARKIDIANVFNAETMIIGLVSGVIGVLFAWIIDFPLNIWIANIVPQAPAQLAILNPLHALLLIALAVVLNIFAGFIPAIIASKKDPVIALRSGG